MEIYFRHGAPENFLKVFLFQSWSVSQKNGFKHEADTTISTHWSIVLVPLLDSEAWKVGRVYLSGNQWESWWGISVN